MDLELFLPKVYHFIRSNYMIDGNYYNQFISAYNANNQKHNIATIVGAVLLIFGIVLLMFGCMIARDSKGDELKYSKIIAATGFIMIVIGLIPCTWGKVNSDKFVQESATTDFGSGFKIARTSFIIQPNEKAFQSNGFKYVFRSDAESTILILNNKVIIPKSTKNYTIYAKIYNSSSHHYYYYLIGNMSNGSFETITTDQENGYWHYRTNRWGIRYTCNSDNQRLMTAKQLNTLAIYIKYIKKHHLEDNFKNDAKLIISNKYYSKDYEPQLVMKGKDGKVLYLKHNISKKDIDNVEMVNYATN